MNFGAFFRYTNHILYVVGERMKARFFSDKPRLVFFIVYTLLFIIAVRAIGYVLPFILALLIAVIMKPLYDHLRHRFNFRSAFAATAITVLIFGTLLGIVGFLLFLVVRQALSLLDTYGYMISEYIRSPELFGALRDGLLSGKLFDTASGLLSALFQAVPLAITFVAVTFALSVYFLHHISAFRDRLLKRAGEDYAPLLSRIFGTAYHMVRSFIRSYLVLYLITFIEAVFIFYLTGVEYPLAFAFITAIADILPVLGPGVVYLPLAISFILYKNYLAGVTLIVFFLITVIIRQVIEPKIVSDGVKLHPLVVLSAIYFSIVSMNIWVLFYVVSIFLSFKVLDTAGAFDKSIDSSAKENKKVDIS